MRRGAPAMKLGTAGRQKTIPGARMAAAVGLALSVLGSGDLAQAQTFPTRPVRIISPFAAGGANDLVARLIAPSLGERLGQQVIVDNRPGAGGLIGTELG